MEPEVHIAGVVVRARAEHASSVVHSLQGVAGAQVHALAPDGRIVVTLEAADADTMTAQVQALHQLPHVLAATLVYQCADSARAMDETMPEEVPDAAA